jgi:hypothetical protein
MLDSQYDSWKLESPKEDILCINCGCELTDKECDTETGLCNECCGECRCRQCTECA